MSSDDDRPYSVGYGKPPEDTRFKPGQSGNPNGKRRKSLSKGEIIAKVRDEPITAVIGGKRQTMCHFEAVIRKVHTTVLTKGSIADLERLMRLYEKHGVAPEQERLAEMKADADKVMDTIMEIFRKTHSDDRRPPDR